MSTFKTFNDKIQEQFKIMCSTGKLFRVEVSTRTIWKKYLESFPEGTNGIFRDPESSQHNCNHCNNFIRRYGNIVAIDSDGNLMSLFGAYNEDSEYKVVADRLDALICNSQIENVFFETYDELNSLPYESCNKTQETYRLGVNKNVKRYTKEEAEAFGVVKPNEIKTFNHFHLDVPKQFVDKSGKSLEQIMAHYRDKYSIFKRAMEEIPLDTLVLVKDLINQGSLLDGTAHLNSIKQAIQFKLLYDSPTSQHIDKSIHVWNLTYNMEERIAKFKNTLIGVLCTELAEGEELNKACLNWNKRVDPANYHKATAPITQKQIAEAQKFVEENGYTEAFSRRLATIDDIKASEVKHINAGDGTIKEVSIFDNVKATSTQHKRSKYEGVEEVSIDKFMSDILPNCTQVEALLKNNHEGNLAVITTANNPKSKPIFKWDNNYSWTFNGNLAGKSQIKEAVKLAGGEVEGILNFRLAWNEEKGTDRSDLDIWAVEPSGRDIGFSTNYRKQGGRSQRSPNSGQLDVDNTNPSGRLAVENITWTDPSKMQNGVYKLWINQYSARNSKGFKVEIEFNGEMYSYEYNKPVKGNVQVAEVTLKDSEFSIKHILPVTDGVGVSKEYWGLETNEFHKVNLVCLSPNHWDKVKAGNLHYMFFLEKCKPNISIRSFHIENLKEDLKKYRKTLEVLGATTMIESSKKECLAGLGFNSTVRDFVILKCKGSHNRMIKVVF